MSELVRFYGIVIAIFFRGEFGRHKTPHVHVSYAEEEASLAIDDGRLLDGRLSRISLRLARQWLRAYRAEVREAWRAAQAGEPVGRVGRGPEFGRNRQGRRGGES